MTRLQMVPDLPWSVSPEDQRRFRSTLLTILLTLLFFSVVMPFIPVPEETIEEQAELPPRLARLVLERKQQQAPPPEPAPVVEEPKPEPEPKAEEPKPEELPKPVEEPPEPPRQVEQPQPETARDKAARSGLLAFKDQLADLRDDSVLESVSRRSITTEGTQARRVERSIVTEGISQGSGGINTAALSRDTGGTGLAGRATSRVESPVGDGSGGGGGQGASTGAGGQGEGAGGRGSGQGRRSEENVQITFDRNKSAIYNIYNRALRKNPALQGKVVVKLTIAPSGKVTGCTIVSSELNDPALERKLVQRIKLLNFGPEDVAKTTVNYPIDFFPA